MSELKEQICRILRRRYRCICGSYGSKFFCTCVSDLFELVLEKCEDEHRN